MKTGNDHTMPDAAIGSITTYTVGFGLSILLTLIAFAVVGAQVLTGDKLVILLAALAIAQLLTQLVFFLHLGHESRPRWNLLVFSFMLLVVLIVAFGSLWIMHYLDYHHGGHGHNLSPQQTDQYIQKEEGIQL